MAASPEGTSRHEKTVDQADQDSLPPSVVGAGNWENLRSDLVYYVKKIESACRLYKERHRVAAQIWERWGTYVGLLGAVVGVLAGLFTEGKVIDPFWASFTSTTVGILAAVQAFLKPTDRVAAHKRASNQWSILEDKARIMWALQLAVPETTVKKAQEEYEKLIAAKGEIFEASPTISLGVESKVPPMEVALSVGPSVISPGESLNVSGSLNAKDHRKKVIDVGFWLDGSNPIELSLETNDKGVFSSPVIGPLEPGNYIVTADYEGVQGRTRVRVVPAKPEIKGDK